MNCHLCKLPIDIKKERYTHVEDWDKKEIIHDIWTHLKCFKEAMNRNPELEMLEEESERIFKKIKPMLNQITIE